MMTTRRTGQPTTTTTTTRRKGLSGWHATPVASGGGWPAVCHSQAVGGRAPTTPTRNVAHARCQRRTGTRLGSMCTSIRRRRAPRRRWLPRLGPREATSTPAAQSFERRRVCHACRRRTCHSCHPAMTWRTGGAVAVRAPPTAHAAQRGNGTLWRRWRPWGRQRQDRSRRRRRQSRPLPLGRAPLRRRRAHIARATSSAPPTPSTPGAARRRRTSHVRARLARAAANALRSGAARTRTMHALAITRLTRALAALCPWLRSHVESSRASGTGAAARERSQPHWPTVARAGGALGATAQRTRRAPGQPRGTR